MLTESYFPHSSYTEQLQSLYILLLHQVIEVGLVFNIPLIQFVNLYHINSDMS